MAEMNDAPSFSDSPRGLQMNQEEHERLADEEVERRDHEAHELRETFHTDESVGLYFAAAEDIVANWQWWGVRGCSHVVVIRGVRGSGKQTMAAQIKMIAESKGMTAVICSTDAFFTSNHLEWSADKRQQAHEYCVTYAQRALQRRTTFVIVASTNCSFDEWREYARLTYQQRGVNRFYHIHGLCRVNFVCHSQYQALDLSARAMLQRPHDEIQSLFEDYEGHNRFFHPHFDVHPVENTWSDIGPPTHDWPEEDRGAPLNRMCAQEPDQADPRNFPF